jgi:hypothetical protein
MNTIQRWIGRTILLHDYRGDGMYRLLRVHGIRNTHDEPLQGCTRERKVMTRGQYLITATDLDREAIRSYYVAHSQIREVGFVGRIWHRLMVLTGKRVSR